MTNNLPDVSIIIPTYNRSSLLMETLQSVKNQTLENWECIVVDDGSIDDTEKVVRNLMATDSRIKYFNRPTDCPKGACSCRNYGFELSTGKYIQWLDDDDLLSENKLEFQVDNLEEQHNLYVFAICSWDIYWPGKNLELRNTFSKINKEKFYSILAEKQSFIPALAYLVPRKLCFLAGDWNTSLSLNDDAEYFNRILLKSNNLINTEGCYVLYREHNDDRLSRKRSEEDIESFFFSMQLIQAYLKLQNINARAYFKWKLLKWFLGYYKTYPEIIFKYRFLLKENGINIKFARYYLIKHEIYKLVYPVYKELLTKQKS